MARYRQPREDEYTEEIQYGELRWKTTPERKAYWNSFWAKMLAAVEKDLLIEMAREQDLPTENAHEQEE